MKKKITIHWFRRDLRLDDNAALHHALMEHDNVLGLFIFDTEILDLLEEKNDARVTFILNCINQLNNTLIQYGSALLVKHGKPVEVWKTLIAEFDIEAVYINHDYEPYAIQRDENIKQLLSSNGVALHSYKDQVIFEKGEVVKDDGTPYTIFTPYSRKWKERLNTTLLPAYPVKKYTRHFFQTEPYDIPSLEELGFMPSDIKMPAAEIDEKLISNYHNTRDYPGIPGTSRLGVHLRFGTISIRTLVATAMQHNEKYLNELIWREFYQAILWFFPFVVTRSFKKEYDRIEWRNNEKEFEAWCAGKTGYPIVDAGMRELNATGYMHNRVRMIVASFLTKHLLIDWRWGEAWFAKKLLDYELASNNGGWQWAAGTGVDAAPYFRIFNPTAQAKKFDPQGIYIRRWVPEFEELRYTPTIVDHAFARERALRTYKSTLSNRS